MTGPIYNSI